MVANILKLFLKISGAITVACITPIPALYILDKWGYWAGCAALVITAALYVAFALEYEKKELCRTTL